MTERERSILFMLGFCFLWAIVELLGAALLARYSVIQVVWTRYLVHLLLLLVIFVWHDPVQLVRTQRLGFQTLRSFMMLIMPMSWMLATRIGAGDVVYSGFWSAPFLIVALTAVFLKEPSRHIIWLAAAGGGLAAALIFSDLRVPKGAQWIPLIGMTASFSIYVVMTRSLRGEATRANLFHSALLVFVLLTPVVPSVWQTPAVKDIPIFFGVGAFGLVTLWLLDRSTAYAPPGDTAPIILIQVPFALALGWIAGHNGLDTRTLILLTIVCIASAIPLLRTHSSFRRRENP